MSAEEHVLHGPRVHTPLPDVCLGEYLLNRLKQHGDNIAQEYLDEGRTYTFSELLALASSVTLEMRARGIREGDIVAVCVKMSPDFPPVMLATLFAGATLAPINPAYDEGDFKMILSILEPRFIFTVPEALANLEKVLPLMKNRPELIVLGDNPNWNTFLGHTVQPDFQATKVKDYEDKVALIMCSSGTTGMVKGVMITHKNIHAQIVSCQNTDGFNSKGNILFQMSPVFWISGAIYQILGNSFGQLIVLRHQFEEETFMKTIQDYKVTFCFLAANQLISLAKNASVTKYDISSLKYIVCGGAAMTKETQEQVSRVLQIKICQMFAMTEIMLGLWSSPSEPQREGSAGKATTNLEVKIVDMITGENLGPRQEGELCFRGPCLTKGYYRNPEATAATIDSQGWLHSGDIAYYDEEEYFYIVDRIKDLIKYRGHHVSPAELESRLMEHPQVKEAAVVGVKHDLDQERPMAFVVRQPGASVTEEDLVQFVQSQLAEHKWLRAGVRFVDKLPKTSTGKIQRRILRDIANKKD